MENKKIDYLSELIMTFSNKKSLFSSKKIERFLVFNIFIGMTIFYIIRNIDVIKPLEFAELVALWLVYGGYNSFQNYRDKKLTQSQSPDSPDNPDAL